MYLNRSVDICTLQTWTGWPDWANFCPLGDCLLWAVFENFKCSRNFPQLRLCIILAKNGFGYISGDFFTNSFGHSAYDRLWTLCITSATHFFHQFIWSPWTSVIVRPIFRLVFRRLVRAVTSKSWLKVKCWTQGGVMKTEGENGDMLWECAIVVRIHFVRLGLAYINCLFKVFFVLMYFVRKHFVLNFLFNYTLSESTFPKLFLFYCTLSYCAWSGWIFLLLRLVWKHVVKTQIWNT
jgi:hypothetical protein